MKTWEVYLRTLRAVRGRRSFIFIFLLVTFLIAPSSDGSEAGIKSLFEGDHRPRLTLLWHDGYRLASHSLGAMSREVERIFSEIGVEVCWHDGSHGLWRENEPPGSMAIRLVLLRVDSSDWGHEEQVMGAAVRNQETPGRTHTVFVFLPNVLRTLGLHSDANVGRWRQVARALGRVLAHEIVHAVAPGHPHRG